MSTSRSSSRPGRTALRAVLVLLVVLALVFCLVTLPLRIWLKTRGAQRFAAL